MKATEQTAKTTSPRTAIFATLRARLHANGTTAPKIGRLTLTLALTALTLLATSAAASAATPSPHLTIHALPVPTRFSSAHTETCLGSVGAEIPSCDQYRVTVVNTGSQPTSKPLTLTDLLPAGVHVIPSGTRIQFFWGENIEKELLIGEKLEESLCNPEAVPVTCEFTEPLLPDQKLEMFIFVTTDPGAEGALNTASVTEEGGEPVSTSEPDVIDSALPPFGPSAFTSDITAADGRPATQAGAHPYEFVNRINLNTKLALSDTAQVEGFSVQGVRDVAVDLPLGFYGSGTSTPRCTFAQLQSFPQSCPHDTQVGRLGSEPGANASANSPVYNMVPEHGAAAEFGFRDLLYGTHVIVANVAPTPAGYVLRATAREVPEIPLTEVLTTFYGNPAAKQEELAVREEKTPNPITPVAMFTNPADCSGQPLSTTVHVDSWANPGPFNADGTPNVQDPRWVSMSSSSPPVTGCGLLQFHPTFTLLPTASVPDAPTGLKVDLKIPQNQDPATLATPPLRDVTVTLPQGLAVSPSSATGLQACSDAQIGYLGGSPSNFTPGPGSCPAASQIGTVKVSTPLLEEELEGEVFLGSPECSPCSAADAQSGRMVRLFIQIHSDKSGITIKSPGTVSLDPATGRLVSSFKGLPQMPFSELRFAFKEGPRAPLSTPSACGEYEAGASLVPWSSPYTPTVSAPSRFSISGCGGSPFSPAFAAGTVNNQAGQFSPLTVSFSRTDPEQNFSALEAVLPPGVLAKLAGVPECGEAELNAAKAQTGECPAASQIGTATVAAGPGPQPFYTNGRVYLTGAYNGGPFGAVTIVPAVAGPFNLGNVVVRGSIRIDPVTAQGSVVTDAFPTILDGIPLQMRSVNVTVDRPGGFSFNSTTCNPSKLTATIASTAGTLAGVSSPYQAANCPAMPFHPVLSVSTAGITSKANGASLHVKITSNGGPDHKAGEEEANIAKVELTIPNALPSRLTTLQKACTEAQFNADPAGCPAASDIATAIVRTPLLANPLVGPVYFVSHGGAAFPDTEIILQGEGVKLLLDGHTDIKKGVTYSRFQSVPDAPFSSFEFLAPEGPYSIFAANGNLCAPTKTVTVSKKVTKRVRGHLRKVTIKVKKTVPAALEMPTTITAQSGAVLTQTTKIAVLGCPTAKTAKKANSARKAKRARRATAHGILRRGR